MLFVEGQPWGKSTVFASPIAPQEMDSLFREGSLNGEAFIEGDHCIVHIICCAIPSWFVKFCMYLCFSVWEGHED